MAKKATPKYVTEIKKRAKDYGNIITTGREVLEYRRNHKMLSISPSMDYGLKGGVKEGTLMLISGDDKSGKTTLALHIAAKHQNDETFIQADGETTGRPIFYFNSESRLDEKHLQGIAGLDPDKMVILQKNVDKQPPPAEVLLDSAISVINDPANRGAIVIIDSTSNMATKKELTENIKAGRTDMPKLLSRFCMKFSPVLPDNNILLIIVTHLISNTAPHGPNKMPDCGRKIRYAADTIMQITHIHPWMTGKGDDATQIGQQVHWQVDCATKGTPGTKIDNWLRYGIGIDEVKEAFDIGNELALIDRSGSWYYPYGKDDEFKIQGQDKFVDWMYENPDYINTINSKIQEIVALELEDEEE